MKRLHIPYNTQQENTPPGVVFRASLLQNKRGTHKRKRRPSKENSSRSFHERTALLLLHSPPRCQENQPESLSEGVCHLACYTRTVLHGQSLQGKPIPRPVSLSWGTGYTLLLGGSRTVSSPNIARCLHRPCLGTHLMLLSVAEVAPQTDLPRSDLSPLPRSPFLSSCGLCCVAHRKEMPRGCSRECFLKSQKKKINSRLDIFTLWPRTINRYTFQSEAINRYKYNTTATSKYFTTYTRYCTQQQYQVSGTVSGIMHTS